MGLQASVLLPTPAGSAHFLAIRRRSRWQVSVWLLTHTHTLPWARQRRMDGSASSLSYWRGKKSFPQRRRIPHTRHLSPLPRSLSPSPTHRRAQACRGALPTCPFPSGRRRGVARAPQKVPAHPGSMLCVSSPLLRVCKSSDVLPPLPALQPDGGCPSRDSCCS